MWFPMKQSRGQENFTEVKISGTVNILEEIYHWKNLRGVME